MALSLSSLFFPLGVPSGLYKALKSFLICSSASLVMASLCAARSARFSFKRTIDAERMPLRPSRRSCTSSNSILRISPKVSNAYTLSRRARSNVVRSSPAASLSRASPIASKSESSSAIFIIVSVSFLMAAATIGLIDL